jgi:hypothetical protein
VGCKKKECAVSFQSVKFNNWNAGGENNISEPWNKLRFQLQKKKVDLGTIGLASHGLINQKKFKIQKKKKD